MTQKKGIILAIAQISQCLLQAFVELLPKVDKILGHIKVLNQLIYTFMHSPLI